jgi:hypothetical protein
MAVTATTVVAALHKVLPPTMEDHITPYANAGGKIRKAIGRAGVSTPRKVTREENSRIQDQKRSTNASVLSLVGNYLRPNRGLGSCPLSLEKVDSGEYFDEVSLATNPILALFRTRAGVDLYRKLALEGDALPWMVNFCNISSRMYGAGITLPQGFLSRPLHTFLKYRDDILSRLVKVNGDYRKLIQKQERILAQIQINLDFQDTPNAVRYLHSSLICNPVPATVTSLLENHFQQLSTRMDNCRHLLHPSARTFLTMELMARFINPWELNRNQLGISIPDYPEVSSYMQKQDAWKPYTFLNTLKKQAILRDDLKIT